MEGIQGLQALMENLKTIKDKTAKKAAKAGINAALAVALKAAKAAVNSSGASSALKKDMRTVLGKYLRKRRGEWLGKVGLIVKRSKKRVASSKLYGQARTQRQSAAANSAASSQNAASGFGNPVWWVLGTQTRRTGQATYGTKNTAKGRRKIVTGRSGGHSTGKIVARFPHLIKAAISSCEGAMMDAARNKIAEVLAREAAKAKK